MGKSHKVTEENRKKVIALAQRGVPQDLIGIAVGIHKETLIKYYRDELDQGMAHSRIKLWTLAHERAKESDSVLIFLCKTVLGLREKDPVPQTQAAAPQIFFVETPPGARIDPRKSAQARSEEPEKQTH